MSSWAYCTRCDASIRRPTIEEFLIGHQHCKECNALRLVPAHEYRDFLQDMFEKVQLLCAAHDEDHNVAVTAVTEIRERMNSEVLL